MRSTKATGRLYIMRGPIPPSTPRRTNFVSVLGSIETGLGGCSGPQDVRQCQRFPLYLENVSYMFQNNRCFMCGVQGHSLARYRLVSRSAQQPAAVPSTPSAC